MKPSSDLRMLHLSRECRCHYASYQPIRRWEKLKAAEEHLKAAKEERKAYRIKVQLRKTNWDGLPVDEHEEGISHCSLPISMLYSFDHAQIVHDLSKSNHLQPGPMYFKTVQKCEMFGICCEGSRIQVNYRINEGESTGKGANSIISYLHHFSEVYGVGEQHLQLQAATV